MDSRNATEAMREVGELKREVADLRAAVNSLRWDASIRRVHAGIDASLRRGHRQIDPVRGAFVVARDELQSLFVHVADTHTTVPFTELVSAGVAAIRRRLQIAGDQACAVTAQLVRQPRRDQHAARGRSSAGVAFAVILACLPQLERRLPWRSR